MPTASNALRFIGAMIQYWQQLSSLFRLIALLLAYFS